jgi:oligoendopeptidase F
MPKKTPVSTPPSWNLSDLYTGLTDPAIQETWDTQNRRADAFVLVARGKIKKTLKPTELLGFIQTYESILEQAAKPEIYAHLVVAAENTPIHSAFEQKMRQAGLELSQKLLFFELELSKIDADALTRWSEHRDLKNYAHYLKRVADYRPHRLEENEEKIISDFSLAGGAAFVRLFDEELAYKTFRLKTNGKTVEANTEETLHGLHSPKRSEREASAKALTIGLKEEARRITFIANALLQHKKTTDRYYRFLSPEESRHLSNETTQPIVDAMSQTVAARTNIVQDFYRFKKKVLGLETLYDYDRYAPVAGKSSEDISFSEAKEIVLSAYRRFSPEFADIAQLFFDEGWIDAAVRPNKRGGAFCMFVTTDIHPYVLVNYKGSLKDVMTLAHELGHAVHAYIAREQTYLNFDMPLTFAETASVFGEMLVFDDLRKRITDKKELFAIYMQKIEEIFATVFRQNAMYRFEQDFHGHYREKGELKTEDFNRYWIKRQREMFGTSVKMTEDYEIWWTYISHFFHSPFYVYSYTFGEILTLSLFAQYQTQGEKMVKEYFNLLRSGGSKTPEGFLAPFNLSLTDENFWKGGLDTIEQLVKEAKELYKKK